ncbi:MAG: GGDEF and EAL domain-containing protein, partial [Longicatena sp.]
MKERSMFKRLLFTLIVSTLLTGFIFLISIYGSDSLRQLKNNTSNLFSERVNYRSEDIQKKMTTDLYQTRNYQNLLTACEKIYNDKTQSTPASQERVLSELTSISEMDFITGAYVILDKDVFHADTYPILYLRDSIPDANMADKSDITAKYGNASILKRLGYSLDYAWKPTITMDPKNATYDFYFKPFQAAIENPNLSTENLAYWGGPTRLNDDTQTSITYSFPLLSKTHEVYGVVGIDISVDQIKNSLVYHELNNQNKNAYVLAKKNKSSSNYQVITSNGPAYQSLFKQGATFNIKESDNGTGNKIAKSKTDINVANNKINLYNTNTPFENEEWYLFGMVDSGELFASFSSLNSSLLYSLLFAIVLGMATAFFITRKFTKPISSLAKQLKDKDPNEPMSLPKVNIKEIDELSCSIEDLSINLSSAESRLSQIMHALNMPLGAMEVFTNGTIYCTDEIPRLLEFSNINKLSYSIKEYKKEIERFEKNSILYDTKVEEIDGKSIQTTIVKYTNQQDNIRWVRFITSDQKENRIVVVADISEEMQEKQMLTYERDHDVLTKLLNRRAFRINVEKILNTDNCGICAMVLWDLDNLKLVNDSYGHDAGDTLICLTADVLHKFSSSTCIVSRMAGDEFLLFFHHFNNKKSILDLVEKAHQLINLKEVEIVENTIVKQRISAGIAWYPDNATTFDDLSKYADFAMYDVKSAQKGGIRQFDLDYYHKDKLLFNGRQELNDLLDNNLVRYAYQPIVDAHTGETFAFEALMRPQGKILTTPSDIMRLARAQSQLYRVEYMTWIQSISQFEYKADHFPNVKLFINSIPSIPLLEDLSNILETKHSAMLPRLVIELIETDVIEQQYVKTKQNFVEKWHAEMAIDDYGSGYSNESTLLKFEANYIKIDMEFIQGIAQDSIRQSLVSNVIAYAHNKHIKVIAEGVENSLDMLCLIKMKIDYLQGYYLQKPSFELIDIE